MPYTNEQINTLVNNLSGGAQGYNPNSPTTGYLTPTRTVDATTIGNQTPIQIPPTTIPTSNGVADATNFQLNPPPQQGVEDIVNQGTKPGEATLGYQGLIDRLKAGYSQITGRSAEQQKQNEAQGVNALTADLSGLDTQIFSLVNKANQLDIQSANVPNVVQQSIQGQGVTKAGSAVRTADELRRIAIQKGAIASDALTLESAYYAKNNQLGLAKQKADEAVAAIYDPIQQQIDQQLKLLEVTKPFMEAEQKKQAMVVEAKLAERQKNLEYARDDKQSVIALIGAASSNYPNDPRVQMAINEANKIDLTQPGAFLRATNLLAPYQKDPIAVERATAELLQTRAQTRLIEANIKKTDAERKKIGREDGGLFDGYLEETEIKKIDSSPQGKKVKALGDLKQKLEGYRSLVEERGTETPLGGQKSKLDAAYADLKIAYKEAANLGALTGPDVTLLEEAIKPASFGGFFAPLKRLGAVATRQGKGSILDGIDQSLSIVNKNAKTNVNQLLTRDPRYKSAWYVKELISPFGENTTTGILTSPDGTQQVDISELTPEELQEAQDLGWQ